jgi:hypothetical protein
MKIQRLKEAAALVRAAGHDDELKPPAQAVEEAAA